MKTSFLRRTAAVAWLSVPPLVLSALIHMADPDVAGWQGLASHSSLWSVALFGVLAFPFFCLCLCALLEFGWPAFMITASGLSICSGVVITFLGSGATSTVGHLQTLLACTVVVLGTVLVAVIPAAALGWPRSAVRHSMNSV